MADPVCPATGAPMVRAARPMTLSYKWQTVTFDMPGWYSTASDESIHTAADMKVSDLKLAELCARVDGGMSPLEVRAARKRLKLSQRDASRFLGGGKNAFQKYESGAVKPSRAIVNLLRILDRHPEELDRLKTDAADAAE